MERNDESFVFIVDVSDWRVREISMYPTQICSLRARRTDPQAALAIASKMNTLCRELQTDNQWSEVDRCLKIDVRREARHVA
jgi:hypothetical protein